MNKTNPDNALTHAQRLELFDSCYPLAMSLAKRYDNRQYKHSEDIRQEAAMALWKACIKYSCKQGDWREGFNRYAYTVVANHMREMYKVYVYGKYWMREFTVSDQHDSEHLECGLIEALTAIHEDAGLRQIVAQDEWNAFIKTLDARQRQVFEMAYLKGMSLKDIRKKLRCGHYIFNMMPSLLRQYKYLHYEDD